MHEAIQWRDGRLAQFAEGLPVAGFAIAAGHGINRAINAATTGDKDDGYRAWRATAASTKSTLVVAGGFGGGYYGGMIGAADGTFVMSGVGQCAEKRINQRIPPNKRQFRTSGGTFEEFNAADVIKEMILEGAVAGVTSGVGSFLGKPLAVLLLEEEGILEPVVKAAVSKPFGIATKKAGEWLFNDDKPKNE